MYGHSHSLSVWYCTLSTFCFDHNYKWNSKSQRGFSWCLWRDFCEKDPLELVCPSAKFSKYFTSKPTLWLISLQKRAKWRLCSKEHSRVHPEILKLSIFPKHLWTRQHSNKKCVPHLQKDCHSLQLPGVLATDNFMWFLLSTCPWRRSGLSCSKLCPWERFGELEVQHLCLNCQNNS